MNKGLRYTTFNTRMGWVGILASAKGLIRIATPQPSAEEAYDQLGNEVKQATESPDSFGDLVPRLTSYFSGGKVSFPDPLDLSRATPFQRRVWEATRLIPYGETRSYGWVAEQIEQPKAARAVGQALSRNPLLIAIPCHRVLAHNGMLGGFTGGIEKKRQLLYLEDVASRMSPPSD
jgi:O-6-methylguanine DNA methyltransferase